MKKVAALLAVTLSLAACSSSSSSAAAPTSSSSSSTTMSAADYVTGVCTAIGQYQADVKQLQTNFNPNTTDLASLKQSWLDFLQGMLTATQTLVSSIEGLGVPDTSQGQQTSDALKKDFDTLQADLQKLADESQSLSPDNAQSFMSQFQPMIQQFQTDMQGFGQDLSQLNDSELEAAFSQAPQCSSIAASASASP